MSVETAVILAAGIGSRLFPLTKDIPKCLIDFKGMTILKFQLTQLHKSNIKKVVISIGGFSEKVVEYIQGLNFPDMKIECEFNPFYFCSNNLVSLWTTRHHMSNGFILLNGDIIFDLKMLQKLCQSPHEIDLGCRPLKDFDEDDMKVTIKDGLILNVNKDIHPSEVHAESLGMLKFSPKGAEVLVNNLEHMVRVKDYLNMFYLAAISKLTEQINVYPCYLDGRWFEMDYIEDFKSIEDNINQMIL